MPSNCLVVGCGKVASRDAGISFFRLPSILTAGRKVNLLARERRNKWITALKRADLNENLLKYGRICSRHFHSGKPAALHDKDNPDWIPTQNMGYDSTQFAGSRGRYFRKKARVERNIGSSGEHPTSCHEATEILVGEITPKPTYEELQAALQNANREIEKLKKELQQYKLEEEHFENHPEDVLYFTGFPELSYVKNILSAIEPYMPSEKKLSKFQQLLLTLIKLRLNFHFTYLAKIFQVHRTTVSRTFEKVIDLLYHRFKTFIYWPTREELQINMPASFKQVFGEKATVVIDCFEIFIEKSTNLEAAARTWSNYKHHHTIKFLIGISPQGCIIYISQAFGGRASDKYITENSNFLSNLDPRDLVIADRGFAVDESVKLYGAEIKYPVFRRGKNQLDAVDLEETRKLSSVRIHVERIIGLLKGKFLIFKGTFPLFQLRKKDEEFALIDKIVTVCASFINLCPSIVPIME